MLRYAETRIVFTLEEKGIEFKFAKMEKLEDVSKNKDEMLTDRTLIVSVAAILKRNIEETEQR
jgi:hypothetical protein